MMWPRNCGPASFQLRRAPSARSANRPLRVPIHNVPAMMKRIRARARHCQRHPAGGQFARGGCATQARSEEHTSELQSHSDLVCRLLLEKKKKKKKVRHRTNCSTERMTHKK